MPNWCDNSTKVYGPKDKLQKFIDKVTPAYPNLHGDISLKRLMPMPMVLRKTPKHLAHEFSKFPISQEEREIAAAKSADYEALCMEKTGYKDWYNWACDKWGTKWGDCDTSVIQPLTPVTDAVDMWTGGKDIHCVEFDYQTAWSPFSTKFWDKVSKKYKDLIFVTRFNEPGMDFFGVCITRNGVTKVHIEDRISEVAPCHEDEEWDEEYWSRVYGFIDKQEELGLMKVGLCLR